MRRSWIAESIINDYRREQAFKKKKRQNCKEKKCSDCNWEKVCSEVGRSEEEC